MNLKTVTIKKPTQIILSSKMPKVNIVLEPSDNKKGETKRYRLIKTKLGKLVLNME